MMVCTDPRCPFKDTSMAPDPRFCRICSGAQSQVNANSMGCICPPGANKDCQNPLCPRKGASALQPVHM